MLTHGTGYSQGRIEVAGGYQYIVKILQKRLQIELHTGFSVTSGYADNLHLRLIPKHPLRLIDKTAVDAFFHRRVDDIGHNVQNNQHSGNHHQQSVNRSNSPAAYNKCRYPET